MRLPVFIASDFTGLLEYFMALIVWCIGVICVITAIALAMSRNSRRGRGDPFAFIAMVSSVINVLLLTTVWAHYDRVDYIALICVLLPGIIGVLCLIASRPRR